MNEIVIVAAKRTPMGGFQGALSSLSAPELGAVAIRAAVAESGLDLTEFDEVLMGNVISAGVGQAPARQASLIAGLPKSLPCTTISKVCGSGMKSVMMGADSILCGHAAIVIAGGMESMSRAPYLLSKARSGHRLGHQTTSDSMFVDGLEDAQTGRLMGTFAQDTGDQFEFTREQMDDYSVESLRRSKHATETGLFNDELTPVTISTKKGELVVDEDEQIKTAKPEKIPLLKPAFKVDGTVTAANSSSISDGAAALILMSAEEAIKQGATPIAKVKGYASHAQSPEEFTLAPVGAIDKLLKKVSWSVDDVDLFEVNEAFAVVALLAITELGLDHNKVNVNGGACALGHPLGASGARIIVTLLNALRQREKKRGVASLCIGGGEATAIAVELV